MKYTLSTNTDPTKASYGQSGAGVLALQQQLNKFGAGLAEDSKYGPLTQAAFQKYGNKLNTTNTSNTPPTPESVYKDIDVPTGTYESPETIATRKAQEDYLAGIQAPDEAKIQQDTLARFQAEIDATNSLFAEQLARAKIQGAGRLGTTTAISARRGLTGSDFGEAAYQGTQNANEDVYRQIEAEKSARISAIMGKARQDAADEIARKREEYTKGIDARLAYYSQADERRGTNTQKAIANILNSGITDISQIDPVQLKQIATYYGITVDDIKQNFNEALQTKQAEQQKADQENRKAEAEIAKLESEPALALANYNLDVAKFNEDKIRFGLEYALKAQDAAVKKLEADTTKNGDETSALSTINLVNTMLNNPNLKGISGFVQGYLGTGKIFGNQELKNQYNQLKGILSLENRQKLKGSGAVSDFESRTLEQAASSLGRNLNDADFEKQLKQIRGSIATSHGQTASVKITDPSTGESQSVTSDSAGIAQAIKDGLLVEYN